MLSACAIAIASDAPLLKLPSASACMQNGDAAVAAALVGVAPLLELFVLDEQAAKRAAAHATAGTILFMEGSPRRVTRSLRVSDASVEKSSGARRSFSFV